ncbi:sequence orphan [Pseudozyma hubeiensis SY62]|uniref:Sequence orphan n=1 Tax=Pseudozyma hubeiensis (strain SY62) TaxID=1305764 RepID=R9P8L6_PSEHS|nr:sequence orphan [Pseudozyma hubeiensis SY62]GAC97689.1 sequence orphan [Pseudozyma hubeiensis SY62]
MGKDEDEEEGDQGRRDDDKWVYVQGIHRTRQFNRLTRKDWHPKFSGLFVFRVESGRLSRFLHDRRCAAQFRICSRDRIVFCFCRVDRRPKPPSSVHGHGFGEMHQACKFSIGARINTTVTTTISSSEPAEAKLSFRIASVWLTALETRIVSRPPDRVPLTIRTTTTMLTTLRRPVGVKKRSSRSAVTVPRDADLPQRQQLHV